MGNTRKHHIASGNLLQEEIFANHLILHLEEILAMFEYSYIHNRRYIEEIFGAKGVLTSYIF